MQNKKVGDDVKTSKSSDIFEKCKYNLKYMSSMYRNKFKNKCTLIRWIIDLRTIK